MIETKIRRYENIHILLWLLKDTCWLMEWRLLGVSFAVPAILAAFFITWLGRKNIIYLFHNLAVSCWICANSVWLVGEFYYDDSLRPYASVFFGMGLFILAVYYLGVVPWKKWHN